MSNSPLYRAGIDTAHKQYEAGANFARKQYQTGANFARKHSRVSMAAAAVAAFGMLGAASFAGGTGPSSQAIGNAASSVQSGSHANAGQSPANLFAAVGGSAAAKSTSAPQPATAQSPANLFAAVAASVAAKPTSAPQLDVAQSAAKPAATASAAAHTQPAKQHAVTVHSAKAVAKAAQPKPAPKPKTPYLIYDSVTPSSIPTGEPAAVYADGAYAAASNQVTGHHDVIWIDTNGSDTKANVLDVEPGDATPAGAAQWVQQRLTEQPNQNAIVYTMMSDWQQVKDNVGQLPSWMQAKVKYWIADPTGVPHVVAGSSATQWYWGTNYDITSANWDF